MLDSSDEEKSIEKHQIGEQNLFEILKATYKPVTDIQISRSEDDTLEENQLDISDIFTGQIQVESEKSKFSFKGSKELHLQASIAGTFTNQKKPKEQVRPSTSTSSLPSDSPDSDFEIHKAFEKSQQEESILPILKQELRLKIQTRRLSEGQGELVPQEEEAKVYELSEEEKEKYLRRLTQNRESLRRSRSREIQHEEQLKQKFDMETARHKDLQREKKELLKKKETLLQRLNQSGLCFDIGTSKGTCIKCGYTFPIQPS